MATGCSSSRPMRPSRPSTSSSTTISTRSIDETEARLGAYIRARQADHGGWPLFHGGAFDVSCTVKAYYALKLIGDDPDAPHMVRARKAVLAAGGAARCNVFTRITLALFGQVPWARRTGDAGGDHVLAQVVPLPSGQGLLLVAHHHRAARDPARAKAPREEPAGRRASASCSPPRRNGSGTTSRGRPLRSGAS